MAVPSADPSDLTPRNLAGRLVDLLLPPRCLGCGATVDAARALCATCWSGLAFLGEPLCVACGQPFEVDLGDGMLCAGCLRKPPPWNRARAALAYDAASRALILGFKHGDRTESAPAFADWMARAGRDLVDDCEVMVPVPLHWTRLWARRYNQAALLAREMARGEARDYAPGALRRVRRTRLMGRLGAAERRRTLAGAIVPGRNATASVGGRRVLLIDDVLTSGATAGACVRALRGAGARAVDVLTLARVVHPVS